jgi:hypothetical protein
MKTAVEWLEEIYHSCNTYEKFISNSDWDKAKEMEKEKSYNLDDLRNAYRWGITATIGTSDHFEEFVNNIKSEK